MRQRKCRFYLDNCDNKKFNNILLSRELVKRTIMTIPYNVTAFGGKGQLLEHIKLVKIDDKMFYQLTANLTKVLFVGKNWCSKFNKDNKSMLNKR